MKLRKIENYGMNLKKIKNYNKTKTEAMWEMGKWYTNSNSKYVLWYPYI